MPSPAFDALLGIISGICFMYYETKICFTVVLARNFSELLIEGFISLWFYCIMNHFIAQQSRYEKCMDIGKDAHIKLRVINFVTY